jgi:hypothetical protein
MSIYGDIELDDVPNQDGEIFLELNGGFGESNRLWINKEQAKSIVGHLIKVFELDGGNKK